MRKISMKAFKSCSDTWLCSWHTL